MKINGQEIAKSILESLKKEVELLKHQGVTPHLAVILVGNDPASLLYVRQKELKTSSIGARISVYRFQENISQEELLAYISHLNEDPNIHGIIVQRPLPPHIDDNIITYSISAHKDVDWFRHDSDFSPPVALAVHLILEEIRKKEDFHESFDVWIKNKKIVLVGKGKTAGRPIMQYFTKLGIPFTVIDSKTKNKENILKNADIIISAVGRRGVIQPEFIKKGAILIGVGMHQEKGKMHADYEEKLVEEKASYFTPVPKGVGPVNVAMLLYNLVEAAKQH